MLREYHNNRLKRGNTSFPPLVEPTGLFSLTTIAVRNTNVPQRLRRRTNTHNSRFEFRGWHSLKYADLEIAQCKQVSVLHRTLLQLQLGICRVLGKHVYDPRLLRCGGSMARGHLCDRTEHELADEIVGIRRIEHGEEEVKDILVGCLRINAD